MAQRYQLQVGERSAPGAFGRAQDAAGTGVQVGAALAGVGQEVQHWAEHHYRMEQEWEAASVMNAQNEFHRRVTDWLDNPETGQTVTRRLGAAKGLDADTDKYMDKTAQDIAARLENDNQRIAFMRAIERIRPSFSKQASTHEARERRAYSEQEFQASMAAANGMAANALTDSTSDRNIRQHAFDMMKNAIRTQYYGAPEEFLQQAVDEAWSNADAQRISLIAQDDPVGALRMLEGEDSGLRLLPEVRAKLKGQIQPRAEVYEVQGIVDGLVAEFPQGRERDGLIEIRKRYKGPLEDRIASAYKTRMNELDIDENQERRLRALRHAENRDKLLKQYIDTGKWPDDEDVRLMVLNDDISPEMGIQIQEGRKTAVTRAQTEKRLARSPDWASLTPEQQEERVMREMGVSQAERDAALSYLWAGVQDGSVTDAEINAWYANGRITGAEKERLQKADSQMAAEQKAFVTQQKQALKADMKAIEIPGKKEGIYQAAAEQRFNELLRDLDPASKTYRQEVLEARKQAIVYGVEQSGKRLEDTHWFKDNTFTPFGGRVNRVITGIEQQAANVQEYSPRFTPDKINLPSGEQTAQPPAAKRQAPVSAAEKASYEKYKGVIDDSAKTHGVDVALVRAIIKQESNWNPKAVSKSRAQGLMQLIPETAADMGVKDAFDPEQNIRGGTKYISGLIKKYGGDVEKALAAYNAGPKRVPVKGPLDLSKLPKETQKYVPKVMALYRRYQGETEKAETTPEQAAVQSAPVMGPDGRKKPIDQFMREQGVAGVGG